MGNEQHGAGAEQRRLLAVLSADVAGYSRLMAADEPGTIKAMTRARERVSSRIETHGGTLADFSGDNFLAAFDSAIRALECAIAIQGRDAGEQGEDDVPRISFRIGAHIGDIRIEGGNLYGDGVNIAARLEAMADPGGICLSRQVLDLVAGLIDIDPDDLGQQRLKNIPRPVYAYMLSARDLAKTDAGTPEADAAGAIDAAASPEHEGPVRAQLERILQSDTFVKSRRQQRFLRYIVEQTLAGEAHRLKGYAIGLDVFDRTADFDPTTDSIVRVEAGRLRNKLREYYDSEASSGEPRIALSKGTYVPEFSGTTTRHGRNATSDRAFPPAKPSITVMPFANLNRDPEQEYFADGIADDLIFGLSAIEGLTVITRHSAFAFKDKGLTAREIGAELGVKYLVMGSVRQAANRIRLTAELIEAGTDTQLWSNRFDRELTDIFAVQDEIVESVISALRIQLAQRESVQVRVVREPNFDAYNLLVRGREQFWQYLPDSIAAAQRCFREALSVDPEYAMAKIWLARVLVFPYALSWEHSTTALDEALALTKAAESEGELLSDVHGMRCWAQIWRGDTEDALDAGRRAVTLNANNADAHGWFSMALSSAGQGEEALAEARFAEALSPHPSGINFLALGIAHYVLSELDAAITILRQSVTRFPMFTPSYTNLSNALFERGDTDDALEVESQFDKVRTESQTYGHSETFFQEPELRARFFDTRRAIEAKKNSASS